MRKAFSIHSDFYKELRDLSSDERGSILLALINWATDEEPPQLKSGTGVLFRLMCAQIERMSRINSENGAHGGAPKGNQNAKKTSETTETSERSKNKPPVTVTNTVTETKPNKSTYATHFEEFWLAYPRKDEKGRSYEKYRARLKDGFSEDELLEAAKAYAEKCQRDRTEPKYIKQAKTFLGPNTPFTDFLTKSSSLAPKERKDPFAEAEREWEEARI